MEGWDRVPHPLLVPPWPWWWVRKSHGATCEWGQVPLRPTEYVTKMCGRGCDFNAVINSKCGTSRRAVKKMVVKMK